MPTRSSDPVDRAHLTGLSRPTPPIHRYPPSDTYPGLADLVMRYWVPVWNLAEAQTQTTLQHPVCLIVISNTYARFYGVAAGQSSVTLSGSGWAFGVMFAPAAGWLLWGRDLSELRDRYVPLADIAGLGSDRLVAAVTRSMAPAPGSEPAHFAARAAVEQHLSRYLPADDAGITINRIVAEVESDPTLTRVADLASRFALSERSLQRLVTQRCGISPKWLIQRRRLHDAVGALKSGHLSLSDLAASLGYSDQAHFTHDFKSVTGLTPGAYLGDQPPH